MAASGPDPSGALPPPDLPPWIRWTPAMGHLEELAAQRDYARKRHMTAGSALMGAAVLYILALFVSYVLLRYIVESAVHRNVSWGEIFAAADSLGLLAPLLIGTLIQVGLATFAAVAAYVIRSGQRLTHESGGLPILLIVAGAFGIAVSILTVGGIVGIIAGALTIAGGTLSMARSPPGIWTLRPSIR